MLLHHRRLELRRGITAARRDREERIRYERAKWKVRSTRTKIIRRTATAATAAATAAAAASAGSKMQQSQPHAAEQSKLQLQLQGSPLVRPEHATLSPVKRLRLMQLTANSNTSSSETSTTAAANSSIAAATASSSKTELHPALRDTYDAVVAATADVLRAGTFNYRQGVAQQDFRETGYMCHDCGKPMFSKHGCDCSAQHA
jgi:predicted component of type VI protein secretion system